MVYCVLMTWAVEITKRMSKALPKLPKGVRILLHTLLEDIERYGPVRGNWANYRKLSSTQHHCHIKKGQPTYVVVWEVRNKQIHLVEVIYAGTHEKAPY